MDNVTYSARVIAQGGCVAISWHVQTASASSRINFMSNARTAAAFQVPTTYEPCFVGLVCFLLFFFFKYSHPWDYGRNKGTRIIQ